ncbi:MAG: peroxiredoxin family protein [Candidatus Kapaibacteriota bacterium]|jgi:peroxiredoxin
MSFTKLIIVLFASIALTSCLKEERRNPEDTNPPQNQEVQEVPQTTTPLDIGSKAPDFTMNDINGNSFTLSSLKGKVVMIDFWATWCPPCVRSIPEAKSIWNAFKKQDFVLLGISLDKDLAVWSNYVKEQNMNWTHVADGLFWDNAAAVQYGVGSIPSVWILDKEGTIILKDVNPLAESEKIRSTIAGLLNKK